MDDPMGVLAILGLVFGAPLGFGVLVLYASFRLWRIENDITPLEMTFLDAVMRVCFGDRMDGSDAMDVLRRSL